MDEIEKTTVAPTEAEDHADCSHQHRQVPDHLARLPGTHWALWRCVGLRGAGFPADYMPRLAAPRSAALADSVLQAEERVRQQADDLLARLRRDLEDGDAEQRTSLVAAIRPLKLGKMPNPDDILALHMDVFHRLRDDFAALDAAWSEIRETLSREIGAVSRAIYDIASTDPFREAVIWQNHRAFHTALAPLLRKAPESTPRSSKRRQHEELIANYLQRYCLKNDTIGFFGPVGWATLIDHGETITVAPGSSLLARRNVYFESWCIEALAETLAKDPMLRAWLKPRRTAFVHVEGTMLYLPMRSPIPLPASQAALLQACDGRRAANELAAELLRDPANGLKSEAEIFTLLEYFAGRALISWGFRIPVRPHSEQELRRMLGEMKQEHLRDGALEALGTLEAARAGVARAAGNPDALDQAMGDLEAIFTRLTSTAATRHEGKTYAGRTLVYEDCQRNVRVDLGPQLVESLGPALALVLTSARWFTSMVAAAYREGFGKLYRELARKTNSPTVDAFNLWLRGQPMLSLEGPNEIVDACRAQLQERWAAILAIAPGQRHVTYTSAELRHRILAAFDAPGPGWTLARYHSPDVMIAATHPAAIQQDDYQFVMGELHVATNTLGVAFFLEEHPSKETIFRALEFDLPNARVISIPPKHWPGLTTRTQLSLQAARDTFLEAAPNPSYEPDRSRTIPIGSLVIEDTDAGLVARTRDGHAQFDLIEVFGDILSYLTINAFKILRASSHTPRVTIDRLVVCRETWSFAASRIPFVQHKDEAERFVAARRWAHMHTMPRFVFVKAPVERKPFYVDFDSPIYLDILAKTIHRTIEAGKADEPITITEMLPTPDQTWLIDAEGHHYTSELRLVAVDLIDEVTAERPAFSSHQRSVVDKTSSGDGDALLR
ncbi:MAG TPA: lantibiotic dehydratase [Herpetosiphonaceae bacterium]